MHGSTESESILQTTKVFAHSIFFELHESILGLNSTGRLGEASVKHHFSILTRPSSALAYRTYPVPRIRKLHVFTQLLSPLLYYIIAFVDLQEYLGLAAGDSTIPASNVLRSLFWVRDDIGKYV